MENLQLLKKIHKLNFKEVIQKHEQRKLNTSLDESISGFTLIEMLVVVIIIAVLSAIAAPGWLAFTNQQRLSKVNDAIFSSLDQAQREARKAKLDYSVSFRIDTTNNLQVAVYPKNSGTPASSAWRSLGQNLEIKAGQVVLGTNLTGENDSSPPPSSLNLISPSSSTYPITFDYMGALSPIPGAGSDPKGLIIGVANRNNDLTSINGTKRCVIIKTLLGAMQIGQDNKCNP